ncbi:MAG: type 4a pilus biogenesis protein PilO [Candidatus Acidiferrales bacterium]
MALRWQELPWYWQLTAYALVAAGLIAAGELLQFSPVWAAHNEENTKTAEFRKLSDEVNKLRVFEADKKRLETELASLEEQLTRMRNLVPKEKQTDDFMRLLQNVSGSTQVALRRFTARDVVIKELYAEMPFEVEMDGSYANVKEFFRKLSDATRIVNATGLQLKGIEGARGKFDYSPGTSVAGLCHLITYYTPSEAEAAAAAPPGKAVAPKAPVKAPAKAPAKR